MPQAHQRIAPVKKGDSESRAKRRARRTRSSTPAHVASEREMVEKLGVARDVLRAMPGEVVMHAWAIHRDVAPSKRKKKSALDARGKELIALALAAELECPDCICFHMHAARSHGATEDELRQAITLGDAGR